MDGYTTGGMADEDALEALNDPRQVMMEVLGLVEDLRLASNRLGDAIVAGGLSAREWRSPDARLATLSDQFPDITVDDLITRLAEFAGLGPDWLHGGRAEIVRFNEGAAILYGVVRPLRMAAQRLRMLPPRERNEWPLERALGDVRVGTPLDQVVAALRDLESLAPYIVPLTPEQWNPPVSPPAPSIKNAGSLPPVGPPAPASPPLPASPASSMSQSFTRLRDFIPQQETVPLSEAPDKTPAQAPASALRLADIGAQLAAWSRVHTRQLAVGKWVIVALAIVTLLTGTLLLSMAIRGGATTTQAPPSHLIATPAHLALACSGKGANLTLTLRNSGTTALNWSITAPSGISIATTHGTLKPGATVTLQVKVTNGKAAQGTLTFTSNDGSASVPYTVKCSG